MGELLLTTLASNLRGCQEWDQRRRLRTSSAHPRIPNVVGLLFKNHVLHTACSVSPHGSGLFNRALRFPL